jgi:ketosteroid isomerase-like protein
MDEALLETFRRIYTAVQQGDFEALGENMTHDVEWALPPTVPWGGVHHGHLGVESVGEIFREHVDGIWSEPDEFLDLGDRVVVLGRVSGTGRASGEPFEVSFAHVWDLADGVPSRLHAYFDSAPIKTALGERASEAR